MQRRLLLAIAFVTGGVAHGQGATILRSPAPDAVSVTIYRDNLALVSETRTVEMPAGPFTLVVEDVVDTLLPQSAVIRGQARPLAESNFDFDRLTPASLIKRSVGETVMLTRTMPVTGVVTRAPATILAADRGVVLLTANGNEALYCSGLPERLEFQRIPAGLVSRPQLSIQFAAGEPGERTLTVSYLAHGFAWSADYVAHLDEQSDQMRLAGWMTLTNGTGATFRQAQVQVIAGNLNLIDADERGSRADEAFFWNVDDPQSYVDARLSSINDAALNDLEMLGSCYSVSPQAALSQSPDAVFMPRIGVQTLARMALEEVVVTSLRIAEREELGDYQLYRLPWLTDLDARQTKQVAFLNKTNVDVERFYGIKLYDLDYEPDDDSLSPALHIFWENDARSGLGEPLPRGRIRVFEPNGESAIFTGEDEIDDTSVGLPVELQIARALDLDYEVDLEEIDLNPRNDDVDRVRFVLEHRVVNTKGTSIEMEIRHEAAPYWQSVNVRKSSRRMRRKNGDYMWRFTVPAGGTETLRYEIEAIDD